MIYLVIVAGLALGHAAMYGPQAAYFAELFGAEIRYSDISLGYQLASILAGGLASTIAEILLASTGGKSWSLALYLGGMALITVITVLLSKETNVLVATAEQTEPMLNK